MLAYPIRIRPVAYLITCPDLPEVAVHSEPANDLWQRIKDATEKAIAARLTNCEQIPSPSEGDHLPHSVSLQLELKALLAIRLQEVGETRTGLARRLGWHQDSVDRLFDPRHRAEADQLKAAFLALDTKAG